MFKRKKSNQLSDVPCHAISYTAIYAIVAPWVIHTVMPLRKFRRILRMVGKPCSCDLYNRISDMDLNISIFILHPRDLGFRICS